MDLTKLEQFIITARTQTYSGSTGKVTPLLTGSKQLEYKEKGLLYRDIYFTGKNTFTGIETIYENDKPIFAMSYYGNWTTMTEKEIDTILRVALLENPKTRLNTFVEWKKDSYTYVYSPDKNGNIDEVSGTETILLNNKQIYTFYSAGSILTNKVLN